MSLPADGVNANTLAETTTIPTRKKLIFLDPDTNEGGIITLENLTKQILSNLTSQTFNLDQGNKTLLAALNELNSKTAALIGTTAQKDITEIPINGALKFALVFCGNNMYFANTNSNGTQAFVRAVSAPEKTVTCTTIQNKLIIRNDDENAKAYMCKIF